MKRSFLKRDYGGEITQNHNHKNLHLALSNKQYYLAHFNENTFPYTPLDLKGAGSLVFSSFNDNYDDGSVVSALLSSLIIPSCISVFRLKNNDGEIIALPNIPKTRLQFIEVLAAAFYITEMCFKEIDNRPPQSDVLEKIFLPILYKDLIHTVSSNYLLDESEDIVKEIMDERITVYRNSNIKPNEYNHVWNILADLTDIDIANNGYKVKDNEPTPIPDIFDRFAIITDTKLIVEYVLNLSKEITIEAAMAWKKGAIEQSIKNKNQNNQAIHQNKSVNKKEQKEKNTISNKQSAETNTSPNSKKIKSASRHFSFKTVLPFVCFIAIYIVTIFLLKNKVDDAYNIGLDQGYDNGYTEGYNTGYDEGYNLGNEEKIQLDTEEIFKNGWIAGYSSCMSDYEDYIPNIQN